MGSEMCIRDRVVFTNQRDGSEDFVGTAGLTFDTPAAAIQAETLGARLARALREAKEYEARLNMVQSELLERYGCDTDSSSDESILSNDVGSSEDEYVYSDTELECRNASYNFHMDLVVKFNKVLLELQARYGCDCRDELNDDEHLDSSDDDSSLPPVQVTTSSSSSSSGSEESHGESSWETMDADEVCKS